MIRKYLGIIKQEIKKHWVAIIIVMAILACVFNIMLFYPGYMSNDTLAMFNAARGQTPTNIAPVVLGLVWRILYRITGENGSMLVLQLFMLWAALCIFAQYVYKKTGSMIMSLACLTIGVLPSVINISGVIWRDCQMTFSLALAVAIFLYAKDMLNKKWRAVCFVLIFILSLYSALSRYNAIIALVPMVFLFSRFSGYFTKLRWQIVATIAFIAITMVFFPLVESTLGVYKVNNSPGLLLDDIIRSSQQKDLETIDMPTDLRDLLLLVRQRSMDEGVLSSNIFVCLRPGDDAGILYKYSDQFKRIWASVIIRNPIRYVMYKAELFMTILIPQTDYAYIWQQGIEQNSYGATVRFSELGAANYWYVHKFGYRYFRMTFEPWFWMLVGMLVFCLTLKRRTRHYYIIRGLVASGILYILGYIPTGATTDYRYIYWSVFAVLMAAVLLLADHFSPGSNLIRNKVVINKLQKRKSRRIV